MAIGMRYVLAMLSGESMRPKMSTSNGLPSVMSS